MSPLPRWPAVLAAMALVLPLGTPSLAAAAPRSSAVASERSSEVVLRQARLFALRQLARSETQLAPGRYPTVAPGRRWRTSGTNGWLAGFYPGRLWLAYESTGRPVWARRATARQAPLAVRQDDPTTHDLGFLLQTSFGQGAALTGSRPDAAVTARAAAALATRWVPQVGAIRSWDGPAGQVTVIVDSLVNLELLFSAARTPAGRPEWREMALQHALTTATQHVRPDGSTTHVVRFDEATGNPVWKGTVQGLADDSTWARGQSWAVHGFTGAYDATSDPRLLDAARRTADFAVAHLPPDGVPYWDYDVAGTEDSTRDTTAAAVLAAGLLDLARLDPDPGRRTSYARTGLRILRSLSGPRYLARGTGSPAVLQHGHHDATYADAGVTYGDYYFLQALLRAQLLPSPRPALPASLVRTGDGDATADLGSVRRISGVSVRWQDGDRRSTRMRIMTSRDGRSWVTARGAVSSGRSDGFETYDVRDRQSRYVRVRVLGAGSADEPPVLSMRVRG